MSAQNQYVSWIRAIDSHDLSCVGEECVRQAHLNDSRVGVPKGFCLRFEAFEDFVSFNDLKDSFSQKLDSVNVLDSGQLQDFYRFVRRKIDSLTMPDEISVGVAKAYGELGYNSSVLMRVSTPKLTLPQLVHLKFEAEPVITSGDANVIEEIRRLWSELFSPEAIVFRKKHNVTTFPKIAVIVQSVVFPDVSGEMFTVEPIKGDKNSSVIEAVWGLPEKLLTGAISPDHYQVTHKPRRVYHQESVVQKKQTIFTKNEIKPSNVPKSRQHVPKLTTKEMLKLTELGQKLNRFFLSPQHIHWWKHKDSFFVINSKPLELMTPPQKMFSGSALQNLEKVLQGTPASPGLVTGPVWIVTNRKQLSSIKKDSIIVTKTLSVELTSAIEKSKGIISEAGGQTSHAAIVSREFNTPCVVNAREATSVLRNGQVVTLNATTGEVFLGAMPAQIRSAKKKMISQIPNETATKLFQLVTNQTNLAKLGKQPIEGVIVSGFEKLISETQKHPKLLIKRSHRSKLDQLLNELKSLCLSLGSRPVIYQLHDFHSHHLRELSGGRHLEPDERNPLMGYRGAFRHSRDTQILKKELSLIKHLRQVGLGNVHLLVPHVRTESSVMAIKKVMSGLGLIRSARFKLWLSLNTPATLLSLESFARVGIDGVVVEYKTLNALTQGIDPENEDMVSEFSHNHLATLKLLVKSVKEAKRLNITTNVLLDKLNVDIISFLVQAGCDGISVVNDKPSLVRQHIYQAEHKKLGKIKL